VQPGKPQCAFGFFSIPSTGVAVVLIATPQFPAPRRSFAEAARDLVLRRGSIGCWYHHRGGAAIGRIDGHAYELAILVGDTANRAQVAVARRVAASVVASAP
jgi:hypothetical protein